MVVDISGGGHAGVVDMQEWWTCRSGGHQLYAENMQHFADNKPTFSIFIGQNYLIT